MKSSFLVVLYLLVAVEASAQTLLTPRPLDPLAAETFAQAMAGSPLVRELVRQLESSNLVIHIESSRALPSGISGTMRFVTSRGGYRYVRISLAIHLRSNTRAAILGHELQHACELAASNAHDLDAVRRLYEAAGHHPGPSPDVFETRAALAVERQVSAELRVEHSQPTSALRATAGKQAVSSRQGVPSRQAVPSLPGVPSRQDR